MNWNILFLISTLLLTTLARYYNQDRMYKINDFQEYLNSNDTNDNQNQMETYFEAIKETFALYHRDARYRNGTVCRSTQNSRDIANTEKSYQFLKDNFYNNCTYVIGNVVIANILNEDISFLNTIEEISGYLFIFGNSIETISLKSLKIIRGENAYVLKEKFSLVVGNNFHKEGMLKYLEVPNLQVILRNNVLFLSNPGLCYAVKKINWDSLLGKNQKIIITEQNETICAFNNETTEDLNCHSTCQKYSDKQYCWSNSSLSCQKINDCVVRSCSESVKCYKNTKFNTEECCHDECAGGCFGPNRKQCLACKNFNNDGACVENCPRQLRHDGLKYIKNPHGKLSFNYICVDKCPMKFLNEHDNCVTHCTIENSYAINQTCQPCPGGKCPKLCHSKDISKNEEIDYLYRETINKLENCTAYDGNIIINTLSIIGDDFHSLTPEHHGIRKEDLKKLEKLEEIYGSLYIAVEDAAPWLQSLKFLRNLRIIRAENIASTEYNGLHIMHNYGLQYLGFRHLKEVRNGQINITNNYNLCFTDSLNNNSIKHKGKMFIINNGINANCKNRSRTCHKECVNHMGCWGPKNVHCVKCSHFMIPENKTCLSNCSSIPGYYFNSSYDYPFNNTCSKCHPECQSGKNTCFGSNANQCNLGCKHFKNGENCVPECPHRHYSDNSTSKVCHPCFSTCNENKPGVTKPICTGPYDYYGPGGCSACNHILLNQSRSNDFKDGNDLKILKCLNNSNMCPIGYYKSIVDFKSGMKLDYSFTNDDRITKILQKWIKEGTNRNFPIASICLPCHPYCLECTGSSNWHCTKCKHFLSDSKCILKCPKDYFIRNNDIGENSVTNECVKCHEECEEGCNGTSEFDCKKCRHAKVFFNGTTDQYFCNSTCGDKMQIFKTSEIICVDHSNSDKLVMYLYYVSPVAIVVFIVLIFTCVKISYNKKKKAFITKYDICDFYPTEVGTNSGVLPNMATLLLITESQVTRQEIIGSGAFGIVYKGIWQPNIDAIDKSNSFLKRNLSKLSQDTSIKLNVAVKILTDISDPANNRELLEEAKVMASVDHPCCLRILAVCLTAHPKLITQFMPLGSLLEFVQKNRALINNITLLVWAKQISCGMEYLESKGIIHCDLAARNVLIQSPRQVKITDFGLAKMLDYSQQQYQFKGGRMPIKWLAIECIRNRLFSSKSDVWSFGVTLWEMFTFGEKPFVEIKAYDILEILEKGQRLNQPKICSIDAYTILVQCWLVDPDARPSFTELRKTFEMMATNPNRYLLIQNEDLHEPFYVDWEEDAQKYEEFLQALVTASHINSSYESATTNTIEKKHIKSVRNRYREMCAYKNCFINNEIYNETNGKINNSNSTNPDYTAIVFQGKDDSSQNGSSWSEYFENKVKCTSNCTTLTNINSNYKDSIRKKILETDLSEDGYLMPESSFKIKLTSIPNETIVYSCEKTNEKEVLINHESSL